ncbi:hypothetical protein EKD16_03675 [Streptomonospora litoralis]|uniref:Uncharacterized protein n=1 Tax=Streptomonospora litoralis TaxID=2498135 RepID=A0A4P6PWR5_9ACTN|nr:hypothetical protein EKD16_03675 [Streptomonospora litoralis]
MTDFIVRAFRCVVGRRTGVCTPISVPTPSSPAPVRRTARVRPYALAALERQRGLSGPRAFAGSLQLGARKPASPALLAGVGR